LENCSTPRCDLLYPSFVQLGACFLFAIKHLF
jgi:hypothetical protein